MRCCSRKLLAHPGKAGRNGRNDFAPQEVPRVLEIGIAFILYPRQVMSSRILEQDGAAKPQ
jgi:hypothetical protein